MASVSNSSPLIALAHIGQLELLGRVFGSVLIPPSVAEETAFTIPIRPAWIEIRKPVKNVPSEHLRSGLGRGERDALALALDVQPDRLIIDELLARRIATALNLPVTGTLGVLVSAKEKGLIESVRVHLDRLVDVGFFIGPDLYKQLLISVGEAKG